MPSTTLRMIVVIMNDWYVVRVLSLFAQADCRDSLFWHVNGDVEFFAQCSDFFWWGTADLEEIKRDDLDLLAECLRDLAEIDTKYMMPELFAARKRGMRPQHAVLTGMQNHVELWELFAACGPERENDLWNPKIDRSGSK